jgi:gamma-butyrobetaine dioxygenase
VSTPVELRIEPEALVVEWSDGRRSRFHHLWLRDNCPQLRHAATNHRVVETSTIAADIRPDSAHVDTSGCIHIAWGDGHESCFTPEWLAAYDYSNGVRRARRRPVLWKADVGDAIPRASYPALLADPLVRHRFLSGFRDYGLGVLHDVPTSPGTVLEVAAELGEVRTTSWGTIFDVVSMPEANSVAYTSLPLVTHTDEGYRDPAPTVQLQHFLVSDTSGGEATLVDGFRVATDLRATAPHLFERLVSTMLHFHFRDATAEHERDGPIITLDPDGELRAVTYSNHSVQPFLLPPQEMADFYEAYQAFGRMRESDEYRLDLAMGSGDLYIVDNHRVLHGRTGFSSTGPRHLQSCYVERDELFSRLAVLERSLASMKGPQ